MRQSSTSRGTPSRIVIGPQGSGKTRNADRLRERFGLQCVVDEAGHLLREEAAFNPYGTLYLAQERPAWATEGDARCVDLQAALRACGAAS